MSSARRRAALLLSILPAVLSACGARYEEFEVEDRLDLPGDLRTLRVRFEFGSLTVREHGEERLLLSGRGRKSAADDAQLAKLAAIDFRPAFRPSGEPGVYEYAWPELPSGVDRDQARMIVRAELWLPRRVAIDVETLRGNLGVVGRDGAVRLHTGAGGLHVEDARGGVRGFTGLGPAILHHVEGDVDVESGGGAMLCYVDRLGAGGLRLRTEEPSVTCRLPGGASFALDARVERSHDGKIGVRNAFGVPVEAEPPGHTAQGTVGPEGGPPVRIVVGTGWISIVPQEVDAEAR